MKVYKFCNCTNANIIVRQFWNTIKITETIIIIIVNI